MLVSAVVHAMEVLEALAGEPGGLSVTDFSARAAVNKGSIARVLRTLQHTGHIAQDPATERYHLALKAISIANRHMDKLGFAALIQPVLDSLARETGELAQLSACEYDRLFVIAKAEGDNRIRVESLLGREIALHASATGKAWLGALPPQRALELLVSSVAATGKLTAHTITEVETLRKELARARSRGFATQREELMEQMSAVAVPVCRGADGLPVGALVIAAPTFRMPTTRILKLVKPLREAADRIARAWPTAGIVSLRHSGRDSRADLHWPKPKKQVQL